MEFSDELLLGEQSFVSEPDAASPANEKISFIRFGDLVRDLSDASGFDKKVVKRVVQLFASQLQESIEAGNSFTIRGLRFRVCALRGDDKYFCRVSRS